MRTLNQCVRGKTVIPGRLVFAGGYPKFRYVPHLVSWGGRTSLFWLGTELVWLGASALQTKKDN